MRFAHGANDLCHVTDSKLDKEQNEADHDHNGGADDDKSPGFSGLQVLCVHFGPDAGKYFWCGLFEFGSGFGLGMPVSLTVKVSIGSSTVTQKCPVGSG